MSGNVIDHYALDTSALVAYIEDEAGADRIGELFRDATPVMIPWPTLMEFYYLTARRRGIAVARVRYAALKHLNITILDMWDEELWLQAALLKARYSLSLADAQIAALARGKGAILLHKDPEFIPLAQELKLEALPLKPRHRN